MAVFPDRIVLKNSTDSQAAIETAIQAGGTDEITQGEIVLGINPTSVQLYAKAGNGSIVTISGVSGGILGDLADVDLSTPATDGQVIAYNATSGNWEPVDQSGGGGYTDPLTTNGDIVIRSGGVTTRLGIGTSGQVLTVTNGIPSWENATGGATSIGDLSDVTLTSAAVGEVLRYNGSQWVDAVLSYSDLSDTPSLAAVATSGNYSDLANTPTNLSQFANDSGFITDITAEALGDLSNVTLASLANGDVLSYNGTNWINTAAPPADISGSSIGQLTDVDTTTTPPTNGQGLIWNSSTGSWEPGTVSAGPIALDDLTDVDTTTATPTNGQVLEWDGSKWVPATLAAGGVTSIIAGTGISVDQATGDVTITSTGGGGGGAVDSVNGETGVVSLGIQDMDDYQPFRASDVSYNNYSSDNTPTAGQWHINTAFLYLPKVDSNGVDQSADLRALSGQTLYITDSDQTVWTMTNISIILDELDDAYQRILLDSAERPTIDSFINKTGGITIDSPVFTGGFLPLADGDILGWVATESKFKPTQPVINSMSDVDTTTTAPTDGQVLTWVDANNQWEPADAVSGGSSRSTVTVTTSSLASGASEDVTLTGTGRAGQFMSVTTDRPAWVVFYADEASRIADASRTETTSPSPGSGVLMEVITTAAETVVISPAVNYFNNESSPVASLPLKVTNKDAAAQTVQVNVKLLSIED